METFYSSEPTTYELLPILLQSGKLKEFVKKTIDLDYKNKVQMWYSNNDNKEIFDIEFNNGKKIHIENKQTYK